MKDIYSYSKISERLAVLLCDRTQRDPSKSICQHLAVVEVRPGLGLEIPDGIKAWLASRGTPHGSGPLNHTYVYPVGGSRAYAQRKFRSALRNSSMWRGEYGQERKELLRFLIQWYREKGL